MDKVISKLSILLITVFLLSSICHAAEVKTTPTDSSYIKALEYASQGKLEDAEKELKIIKAKEYEMPVRIALNIIKDMSDKKITEKAATHLFKGSWYLEKNKPKEAIVEFNDAIKINPGYSESYRKRGKAYFFDSKFNKAISELNKAIKIDPSNELLYLTRGNIYFSEGYHTKAIDDYSKAIEITPNDAILYGLRANAYYKKVKYDKAVDDWNKAMSLEPNNANLYILRGNMYIWKMQYSKARDDYDKAIEIDPSNSVAYLGRGVLNFVYALDDDAACKDFETAIKLNPDNIAAYFYLSNTYYRKHDYDKTWETVNKILELKGTINPSFLDKLKKESGREK